MMPSENVVVTAILRPETAGWVYYPTASTLVESDGTILSNVTLTDDPATTEIELTIGENKSYAKNLLDFDQPIKDVNGNTYTVTEIGEEAFVGNTKLERIVLPAVVAIGPHTFQNCTKLAFATLPLVETVGENAFTGTALGGIELPNATNIDDGAFSGCASLATAKLPVVQHLGSSAFQGTKLSELSIFTGLPPNLCENVFSGLTSTAVKLTVALSAKSNWEIAPWNAAPFIIETHETPENTITVTSGTANPTTAAPGTTVALTANAAPSGEQFKTWEISPTVTFTEAHSPHQPLSSSCPMQRLRR